jgi:glutathione S-transferase
MRLFDYPHSGNGYKVRLLLAHMGWDYEYIPLDILKGETRTAEFLLGTSETEANAGTSRA